MTEQQKMTTGISFLMCVEDERLQVEGIILLFHRNSYIILGHLNQILDTLLSCKDYSCQLLCYPDACVDEVARVV